MALDKNKESTMEGKRPSNDNFKGRPKKDKSFQSKVVIRRLPPTMTEEQFLDQISPVPNHDYFHFVKADMRLGQYAFSRAYLNFTQQEDIILFKEQFDEYVFLDSKGNEYAAIVEFSPFQKIPKKRSKKRDAKCNTIETDPDYLAFLENLKNPDESSLPPAEIYLEEIETREKELKANNGVPKMTTPLIEYLKKRKIEQQKIREEKREERKRKEIEKKRLREEERRRRKAEKDRLKEKFKEKDNLAEKEVVEEKEEFPTNQDPKTGDPIVQVLKNPEREKEQHIVPPKYKGYTSWSKDKERNKKDWDIDKQKFRQKDRTKSNSEKFSSRDKDRSRREKPEQKTQTVNKSTEKESNLEERNGEEALNDDMLSQNSIKSKRDKSCPGNVETSNKDYLEDENDKLKDSEIAENLKSEGYSDVKDHSKDPRVDRRIKNKDRPSLEIYRPGMRRFSTQRNSPQKEISTSTSNSSTPSPSPTPPLVTSNSKPQFKENEKKSQKPPLPPFSSGDSAYQEET